MKSRIRRFGVGGVAALITVGALSGCASTTEPVAALRIVPASQTVVLQPSTQGPTLSTSVTLTNTSALPLIWSSCSMQLERRDDIAVPASNTDAGWEVVWSPICPLVLNLEPPVTLQPGESVVVPITAVAYSQNPGSFLGEPGLYRVQFFIGAMVAGDYRQLPRAASSSGTFTVVAQ